MTLFVTERRLCTLSTFYTLNTPTEVGCKQNLMASSVITKTYVPWSRASDNVYINIGSPLNQFTRDQLLDARVPHEHANEVSDSFFPPLFSRCQIQLNLPSTSHTLRAFCKPLQIFLVTKGSERQHKNALGYNSCFLPLHSPFAFLENRFRYCSNNRLFLPLR